MAHEQFDSYEEHFFLKRRTKVAYGLVGLGENVINETLFANMMLFYNTILQVPAQWVGYALAATRLWDAISDPLMGSISDNTRSRWGRRRPYLILGGVLMGIFFVAMCIPPGGLQPKFYAWYLGFIAFLYYTGYTIAMVPASALGAELTLDYHERTRLNAYRSVLARVGALLAASTWWLAGKFGDFRIGFAVLGVTWAVIGILAFIVAFLGTHEIGEFQRQAKVPFIKGFATTMSNKPFLMLASMVFFLLLGILLGFPAGGYINIYYVYGGDNVAAGQVMFVSAIVFGVTFFFATPVVSWVGIKIGKERAMMIGMAIFAVAPFLSWYVYDPEYPYLQLLFQIPVATALTFLMVFSGAMVADLIDLDELKTHKRREGSFSAVLSLIFKLGAPIGTLGFGLLLRYFAHFDETTLQQSDETIFRLRLILLVVPLIPLVISVIVAAFYPIREHHIREARKIIDERRAQAAAEEGKSSALE